MNETAERICFPGKRFYRDPEDQQVFILSIVKARAGHLSPGYPSLPGNAKRL